MSQPVVGILDTGGIKDSKRTTIRQAQKMKFQRPLAVMSKFIV